MRNKSKKGGEVNSLILKGHTRIFVSWFSMISANIDRIREGIASACRRSGRRPEEVTLIAVSKTFPAERVEEAIRAGVVDIGENYVQELLAKRAALPMPGIRWHFIGHLQSNKVRQIAEWVHSVHALDRTSLAQELDARAMRAGRVIEALVEVNTTGEQTKFGLPPERVPGFIRSLEPLSHIRIGGLMTIGPFLPDPEGSRPMFRTLRLLRDDIARTPQANMDLHHLSMGMTGDFAVAIEEGATLVRIGTAIFGARRKPA
jgi:pyridoxal phosphate enzyme (YggS family)